MYTPEKTLVVWPDIHLYRLLTSDKTFGLDFKPSIDIRIIPVVETIHTVNGITFTDFPEFNGDKEVDGSPTWWNFNGIHNEYNIIKIPCIRLYDGDFDSRNSYTECELRHGNLVYQIKKFVYDIDIHILRSSPGWVWLSHCRDMGAGCRCLEGFWPFDSRILTDTVFIRACGDHDWETVKKMVKENEIVREHNDLLFMRTQNNSAAVNKILTDAWPFDRFLLMNDTFIRACRSDDYTTIQTMISECNNTSYRFVTK